MAMQHNQKDKHSTIGTRAVPFVLLAVAGMGVMLGLLLTTTPDRVGPLGITAFFVTMLLTLICIGMVLRAALLNQPRSPSLLLVVVGSLAVTGALALNTIELGIGDVVLLILFVVTFTIYWTKLR